MLDSRHILSNEWGLTMKLLDPLLSINRFLVIILNNITLWLLTQPFKPKVPFLVLEFIRVYCELDLTKPLNIVDGLLLNEERIFFKLPAYLYLNTALIAVKRLVNLPDASNLTPLTICCFIVFTILFLFIASMLSSNVISVCKSGILTICKIAFLSILTALFFLSLSFRATADEKTSLFRCIDFNSTRLISTFLLYNFSIKLIKPKFLKFMFKLLNLDLLKLIS